MNLPHMERPRQRLHYKGKRNALPRGLGQEESGEAAARRQQGGNEVMRGHCGGKAVLPGLPRREKRRAVNGRDLAAAAQTALVVFSIW